MRSARMSPHTIKTYTACVEAYVRWCEAAGLPVDLAVRQVEQFTAALLDGGAEAATALSRQKGARRFSAWLAAEERRTDPLDKMRPPKLDQKAPAYLTAPQIAALLVTCESREFNDVRDAAIINLMRESMVRADELLSMRTEDVDIRGRKALVRRGKGGKARLVAFSAQTALRLDRYARARRGRRQASSEWFWLPARATPSAHLSYDALYAMVRRRAERAGFRLHPHMLRATGAIEWRHKGGSTASLLTLAGWTSLEMASRYVKAAEQQLAVEEAHRLFDGQ